MPRRPAVPRPRHHRQPQTQMSSQSGLGPAPALRLLGPAPALRLPEPGLELELEPVLELGPELEPEP